MVNFLKKANFELQKKAPIETLSSQSPIKKPRQRRGLFWGRLRSNQRRPRPDHYPQIPFLWGDEALPYGSSVSPIAAFSYGLHHSDRLRFHLALPRLPLKMEFVGNDQVLLPHQCPKSLIQKNNFSQKRIY